MRNGPPWIASSPRSPDAEHDGQRRPLTPGTVRRSRVPTLRPGKEPSTGSAGFEFDQETGLTLLLLAALCSLSMKAAAEPAHEPMATPGMEASAPAMEKVVAPGMDASM